MTSTNNTRTAEIITIACEERAKAPNLGINGVVARVNERLGGRDMTPAEHEAIYVALFDDAVAARGRGEMTHVDAYLDEDPESY